ncbi:sensor histidine kinase [Virgibacillus necropolis]|uniref:Two-component sensor histidine kinase n=1 Tax=Virgibacillus necropolis TaxID=163877 RepID=A0A221MGA8_9BACI|nr:histidine kinase [Virgibacillus necropolis]ASN06696.1 two-component sensor histidine kinase [Virgibacillus necropolis]
MKRITQKFLGLSLRQRLIISAIICVLLPSFITFFVSNYLTEEELEKRAVNQSENTLRLLDLRVSKYFDDILYVSNYLQYNNEINKILMESQNKNNSTSEQRAIQHIKISRHLENITNLLPPFYITILMENGFYYTNYPTYEYNPKNFYDSRWINKVSDLNFYETYWVGTHSTYIKFQKDKQPYLITIARNLKITEDANAYTILSINEKEISNMFREFTSNHKQKLMLIDANGTILSSQNEKKIKEKFDFQRQIDNNQLNYSVVNYKNKDYLLVSRPMSYAGWNLVSLVPYKQTVGNINTIARTTLLLQFFFFAIFLIILIYLVRKFTKPIIKLSRVTKEVENGNLQVRSGIKGKGDIAVLSYSFDQMLDKIEDMINQIKVEERGKRRAELEMLQAQINPHFLFNTLNSLRLKIMLNGDKENAKLIQSLSSLLRMTINRNNEFIYLYEEIEVVDHYVTLMNFRRKDFVELIIDLDSDASMEEVPRFFLQPIIENAIIHGFDQKGGTINVSAWIEKDLLNISLKDSGKGMDNEELHRLKEQFITGEYHPTGNKVSFTGIGVNNVYQRLLMIYGEKFRMEIDSQLFEGTEFVFYIPRK